LSSTKFISNAPAIPGQRKGAGKATNNKKLLASNRLGLDSIRSTPASPALSGVGSPALVSTSVPLSQVAADKAKASRKPIIHLLATGPMTKAALKQALPDVAENDFEQALERVADAKGNKWELTRKYWRELDVWTYDYPEADDRQRAIDNAVSMFDKLRLTVTDPEWDRLLPKVERGQGKCLSKLQVQIAQGLARPPKIKLQKDDGSGRDTSAGEEEGSLARKAMSKAKKGEPMIRSSSQPSATKPKPSEKEAPKKRVLTNKLNKPAAKPVVKPAASPRSTPAPAKRDKIGKPTSKKALSAEKIIDSDEEAEQASQPSQSKPSQPPKKPLPKPVVAKKRPRDDETETSDSSIPLSKKVKKDVLTQPRVASGNQSSNATSNATNSTHSLKNKSTSPHKSSPLASSPPTNASEIDNNSGHRTTSSSSASPAPYSSNKTSRSPIHKHHKTSSVTSSSSSGSTRHLKPEVMDLARKYRSYYPKYQALYHEVENSKFRDAVKEEQLLDMHKRLETMKQQINAGIFEM
jgi:RNA polymerase II elongation factor ELL